MTKKKETRTLTCTENGNQDKELTVEKAIATLADYVVVEKDLEKRQTEITIFTGWFNGLSLTKCAKLAGCSVSWASKLVKKYSQNGVYRREIDSYFDAIRDRFKNSQLLRLFRVGQIQDKALNEMEDKPVLAIKHPAMLRDVMKVSGVLAEESAPPVQIFNMAAARNVMERIERGEPTGIKELDELSPYRSDQKTMCEKALEQAKENQNAYSEGDE
jgi:hypothetical protein